MEVLNVSFKLISTLGTQWWFGGGIDLTPNFVNKEDFNHFHQSLKEVCDKHDDTYYKNFKKMADEYFFIKHLSFARGIGGIFFDYMTKPSQEDCFNFVQDCANQVIPSYIPLVRKNKDIPYSDEEREWKLIRHRQVKL